jgi:hypothetical protein
MTLFVHEAGKSPTFHTAGSKARYNKIPADFAPDQGYRYSNTNFLIGKIFDKTLGYNHRKYLSNKY